MKTAKDASKQSGPPSLGQLVGLFERLYRKGKLELMTASERRAQVTEAIADAKTLRKQAEQKKLKKCSL
jgi:hypothetical protein